jgi:hypothetical protein
MHEVGRVLGMGEAMRFRIGGSIGTEYTLQVRILGIWWTLARAHRYVCSMRGGIEAALLDQILVALTQNENGYRSHRVATVKLGGAADALAAKEAQAAAFKRMEDIFRKAGILPKGAAAVALALLALVAPAAGQDASPPPPCDPAVTVCITTEGWVLGERTWSLGAEPRELPGARLQVEARFGRWRVAARGDATGLVGEFDRQKPETFKAAEGYLAGAWDLLHVPAAADARVGPAAALGAGLSLEVKDGQKPTLPKRLTFGLGARVSWRQGWAYVVVGQHQALRGVAVIGTWQVRLSERVAHVGMIAISGNAYVSTIGVGVRFL